MVMMLILSGQFTFDLIPHCQARKRDNHGWWWTGMKAPTEKVLQRSEILLREVKARAIH